MTFRTRRFSLRIGVRPHAISTFVTGEDRRVSREAPIIIVIAAAATLVRRSAHREIDHCHVGTR
jgi:hypothetical protein